MDNSYIEELFASLGIVTIKRLFGGKAVYFDDLIVGIVRRNGELLLKADAETGPKFEGAGATQWVHIGKGGKTSLMPYWTFPANAFDDPDSMVIWVKLAAAASLRAAMVASSDSGAL